MFEQQPDGIDQQQEYKNRVVQIYDTPSSLNTMFVDHEHLLTSFFIMKYFERTL